MRASHDWLGFTSDWSRKWRKLFNQSESVVKQNQIKHSIMITFNTQLKTALKGRAKRDREFELSSTLALVWPRLFKAYNACSHVLRACALAC